MIFTETKIVGAYLIEPERLQDNRGFFARVYCENEFAEQGLENHFVQCNVSYNAQKNTIRGMHYQAEPHGEIKLVRCTMGAIYDVLLDLRADSASYKQWVGVELSVSNRSMLYIPKGVAHGFQSLSDESEVFYMMGEFYHPESAKAVRWNDPAFAIEWHELGSPVISEKDQSYPDWTIE